MTHLALSLFGNADLTGGAGLWLFLSISVVAMFVVFIPLVSWIGSRQQDREAFYKAETFRRLAESTGDAAKAAIELLREQSRQESLKKIEGMKIGGLINIGVGAGLMIFLHSLGGPGSPYLVGLIPGFIGVALLVYALLLAPRREPQPGQGPTN